MDQVNAMALLVGAALALLCIAIVVYPFLKSRSRTQVEAFRNGVTPEAPDLESVYEAIRTLQLEHQLGKIPDGLYREQLLAYRLQAASVLRQQLEGHAGDPEWLLEQEVLVAREALRRPEDGPASDNSVTGAVCPACGSIIQPGADECAQCHAGPEPAGPDSARTADG